MPVLVELDIFSGRPNPRWLLDEEQSRGLVELLASLPPANPAPATEPGLGYRGFRFRGIPGEGDVVVHHGALFASPGGRLGYRLDVDRAVESFLLGTARSHVDEALLRMLASMIGI